MEALVFRFPVEEKDAAEIIELPVHPEPDVDLAMRLWQEYDAIPRKIMTNPETARGRWEQEMKDVLDPGALEITTRLFYRHVRAWSALTLRYKRGPDIVRAVNGLKFLRVLSRISGIEMHDLRTARDKAPTIETKARAKGSPFFSQRLTSIYAALVRTATS